MAKKKQNSLFLFVKEEVGKTVEDKQQIVLKDISVFRDDVNKDFKYLREEITRVFATKEDLQKVKSELLLWAFVFWATQLGAVFAFIKFFIK